MVGEFWYIFAKKYLCSFLISFLKLLTKPFDIYPQFIYSFFLYSTVGTVCTHVCVHPHIHTASCRNQICRLYLLGAGGNGLFQEMVCDLYTAIVRWNISCRNGDCVSSRDFIQVDKTFVVKIEPNATQCNAEVYTGCAVAKKAFLDFMQSMTC